MNLYLIKILAIAIVTICCIIATYTDIKHQIIPNKLTFSTIIIGIILVSIYFALINEFNLLYYISIIIIYVISYIFWRLGVWAGGDVKLFTAISTLLVPEFLDILPKYMLFGVSLPFNLASMRIPTLLVVFNSVLSIMPIILVYVTVIIIKDKPYLMDKLKKSFNFKETIISLNSLTISYLIISEINVHHPLIKIIFLLILSYIISRIMKFDIVLVIITISLVVQQLFNGNITLYLMEFILLSMTITVKNIYQKRIINDALIDDIGTFDLKEGMILQYPLYYKNNEYYFDKSSWYDIKEKGELICSNSARGITEDEVEILKEVRADSTISIKRGLSFAPFVFAGLFMTLIFGNTYQLLILILGLI